MYFRFWPSTKSIKECVSGFDSVQNQSTDPRPERAPARITICLLAWQSDATLTRIIFLGRKYKGLPPGSPCVSSHDNQMPLWPGWLHLHFGNFVEWRICLVIKVFHVGTTPLMVLRTIQFICIHYLSSIFFVGLWGNYEHQKGHPAGPNRLFFFNIVQTAFDPPLPPLFWTFMLRIFLKGYWKSA